MSNNYGTLRRRQAERKLCVEKLESREVFSVGLAYVGLASAPQADITYLASNFKTVKDEVEVSFLPFEFNPSRPFKNADTLVKETLQNKPNSPSSIEKLWITVDLKWFVHDSGKNGILSDGSKASVYGRPAQQAFWRAWADYNPSVALSRQPKLVQDFLARVQEADNWVARIRKWSTENGVQNKLGLTFVPVLEDEFATKAAYTNLVNAIRFQQSSDKIDPTQLRRSQNGDDHNDFRITDVSLELHGAWSKVQSRLKAGDTWSNDGTNYDGTKNEKYPAYGIADFKSHGTEASRMGVSALYWNADMNGFDKKPTNWDTRTVNVFSGATETQNKARLRIVLEIRAV